MAKRVILGYGDVHWQLREPLALEVFKKTARMLRPYLIVNGGDGLDCGPFSSHPKLRSDQYDPRTWISDEWKPYLRHVRKMEDYSEAGYVYLSGNHEHRIERTIANGSMAWQAVRDQISPEVVFPKFLEKPKSQFIPYNTVRGPGSQHYAISPDLMVVHGWTTCKHVAAKHLELSRTRSIISHHAHRQQVASSRDPWSGKKIEAVASGCMCKLQPIYQVGGTPTDWTHGFWMVYLDNKGHTIYPITITGNSAVLPSGEEIRV